MITFSSELIRTDITCIKTWENYILAGIGGYLHIYSQITKKLIKKYEIFKGQKIYGIVPNINSTNILLYGGTLIKTIKVSQCLELGEDNFTDLKEWILCANWSDEYKIAVVTMNNKFILLTKHLKIDKEVICEAQCILYSAFICNNNFNDLILISGTVFNEVLIWWPSKYIDEETCPVSARLHGHKGVIFSIDYNPETGTICSVSDDRSAILWKINSANILKELQNPHVKIELLTQVFGHTSRVFRCKILNEMFITGGEDSQVILWSYKGEMLRKISAFQASSIWALDCDIKSNLLVIGGGNSGLSLYSLKSNVNSQTLKLPDSVPKSVCILNNLNLVCLTENANLYFYNKKEEEWKLIKKHVDLNNYCLLQTTDCRQFISLSGYKGQIFIYRNIGDDLVLYSEYTSPLKSRIFSFHWLSCSVFLISQSDGLMTLFYIENAKIIPVSIHILPPSKERWSTTACFIQKNIIAVGDRKGHMYIFAIDKLAPIFVFKRIQSHLGITSLSTSKDKLFALGRNGDLKIFDITNNCVTLSATDKLPIKWLAKIVDTFILGFSGNTFVMWDYKNRTSVYEKECGGGHRSWDFLKFEKYMHYVFIKDKNIFCELIDTNSLLPVDLVEGLHANEINSLKSITLGSDKFLVSGGEDTNLKICKIKQPSLETLHNLKFHLSNIRTIEVISFKNQHMIFSAGGRAQIILWRLVVNLGNSTSCNQISAYHAPLQSEDSEMRIMDLHLWQNENTLYIFAACSNGYIKIFYLDDDFKIILKHDVFYKLKCVTKIRGFDSIIASMATDGELVFWNKDQMIDSMDVTPVISKRAHQSGINSFSYKQISTNNYIILTGGDDNAIILNLLSVTKNNAELCINVKEVFKDVGAHCAQITGTKILDDYFLTVSIDQRLSVYKWSYSNDNISCRYLEKYQTAIADIQGFDVVNDEVVIYGNGIEYLKICKKK